VADDRNSNAFFRILRPPRPLVHNPREEGDADFPLGRRNLYIGGAGCRVPGYFNLDLFGVPGVDVVADAHQLPFPPDMFQRVECDAVLEHVREPAAVMREIERVLAPGGYAHVVVPFCHPFHAYPADYHRFTLEAVRNLAGGLEIVRQGWRTGPTATMLVFFLEYVKLWFPWRAPRLVLHGALGWLLFPLRYLDLWLLRSPRAGAIGNHCYAWFRKPEINPRQVQ
jgi:SAM-dependent methyltransferase